MSNIKCGFVALVLGFSLSSQAEVVQLKSREELPAQHDMLKSFEFAVAKPARGVAVGQDVCRQAAGTAFQTILKMKTGAIDQAFKTNDGRALYYSIFEPSPNIYYIDSVNHEDLAKQEVGQTAFHLCTVYIANDTKQK